MRAVFRDSTPAGIAAAVEGFSEGARHGAASALVQTMVYVARCEQSDLRADLGPRRAGPLERDGAGARSAGGARAFLAAHAAELLRTGLGRCRRGGAAVLTALATYRWFAPSSAPPRAWRTASSVPRA